MRQIGREYQLRAVDGVYDAFGRGVRRVLLVAPTGAGKTWMAEEALSREPGRVLFCVHRRELLTQARDRLREAFGWEKVGIIAAGFDQSPHARFQVGMTQTMLARGVEIGGVGLVVFDEAHHYVGGEWLGLGAAYPEARLLGLTATPERDDGTPLADLFDELVVAAKYSELVTAGFLVPCRAFQPPEDVGSNLAADPLESWQKYAEGAQTFAFMPNVKMAEEQAARFTAAGIASAAISGKTKTVDRDRALEGFASGRVRVLFNYNVLTEGVDVPAARCLLLGRKFQHVGAYLQAGGRVLRPAPGKADAIIIDLTGATIRHGFPTDDRLYSLEGDGIRKDALVPLRNCAECGATLQAALMECPECGYRFTKRDPRVPMIYSLALREVFAGQSTPDEAKVREYQRLRGVAKERGWDLYFVVKEYKKLFGVPPVMSDASADEKRQQYEKLKGVAHAKGFKPGFAKVRFKEMFGHWPAWG